MYVVIVYDIKVERVNKVKSFLRTYLVWVQNSVFEGELTDSEFVLILNKLNDIINKNEDSIIIYKMMMEKSFDRRVLGMEKNPITEVL